MGYWHAASELLQRDGAATMGGAVDGGKPRLLSFKSKWYIGPTREWPPKEPDWYCFGPSSADD